MRLDILICIILPNVGYWKGLEIVSKKELDYTKNLLSTFETVEYPIPNYPYQAVKYKIDGVLHRKHLPAVEWNYGHKEWYKKGKLHRDGNLPAIEWEDGAKEWYINGIKQKRCVIS